MLLYNLLALVDLWLKSIVDYYNNFVGFFSWRLHLGIFKQNPSNISVNDCASDSFYKLFTSTSKQNTIIYDDVFKCLPSDHLTTFKSVQNNHDTMCLNKTNPAEVNDSPSWNEQFSYLFTKHFSFLL